MDAMNEARVLIDRRVLDPGEEDTNTPTGAWMGRAYHLCTQPSRMGEGPTGTWGGRIVMLGAFDDRQTLGA